MTRTRTNGGNPLGDMWADAGREASSTADAIWPKIDDLIGSIEKFIIRFCILPVGVALVMALWCVATYLAQEFDVFPYLALSSPTKRCGKTRVFEVLELFCCKPWRGISPSPAALFRMMESGPTLLLDEVESLKPGKNSSESQLAILAILNAGYRKGATVPRCEGPNHKVVHFPVFGPKAFAAIGKLPDTLSDRSVIAMMQRKTDAQPVDRFLFRRANNDAKQIRDHIVDWTQKHHKDVRKAYEKVADLGWLTDRDSEIWMPLFAVCSLAARKRLADLRDIAINLTTAKSGDDIEDSLSLKLLSDVRDVWPADRDRLFTATLLEKLKALPESPWSDFELTARKLAKSLRPFGVQPGTQRDGEETFKGYLRADFDDAFKRYLPVKRKSSVTSVTTRANTGENDDFTSVTNGKCDG